MRRRPYQHSVLPSVYNILLTTPKRRIVCGRSPGVVSLSSGYRGACSGHYPHQWMVGLRASAWHLGRGIPWDIIALPDWRSARRMKVDAVRFAKGKGTVAAQSGVRRRHLRVSRLDVDFDAIRMSTFADVEMYR